jgi:hypothetical protein
MVRRSVLRVHLQSAVEGQGPHPKCSMVAHLGDWWIGVLGLGEVAKEGMT